MKKQLWFLLLLALSFSELYGQKRARDYEILNKLFPKVIGDSSEAFFDCKFIFRNKRLANRLCDHLDRLADSIDISSEFEHYTLESVAKKIAKAKWNKNKVNYPIKRTEEENRDAFSISPILYSKNGRYFFVVVDHYQTHMGCGIFEIMQDESLKLLNEATLLIRTPGFR